MAKANESKNDESKNDAVDKKPAKAKGTRLIAKIAIKGDFDIEDGLGVNNIEVSNGQVFVCHDADLAAKLLANNYAKKPGAKAADDDQPEPEA